MPRREEVARFDESAASSVDEYDVSLLQRSRSLSARTRTPNTSKRRQKSPKPGPSRQQEVSESRALSQRRGRPRREETVNRRKKGKPKSLMEIRRLQLSTKLLIPLLPFCRLLKETLQHYGDFRMSKDSINALQEATEMYLVQLFEDAYRCSIHAKRVTLQVIDIHLARTLRNET